MEIRISQKRLGLQIEYLWIFKTYLRTAHFWQAVTVQHYRLSASLSALLPATTTVATLAASLDCVDGSSLVWVLQVFHHGDGPALLVVMKDEQAICSRHQLSYVVLFIALQLDPQPCREALQEQSIISARSWVGRRLPKAHTANSRSICGYFLRVCYWRRASFCLEKGSLSSGWAMALKQSWITSLLRAATAIATVWSNLCHSSRTSFILKRDSTWANHPAALSVQKAAE